jgi:hypothetical protein
MIILGGDYTDEEALEIAGCVYGNGPTCFCCRATEPAEPDDGAGAGRRRGGVVSLRWWRQGGGSGRSTWRPRARIPDGDTVPVPGWPRWADLLDSRPPASTAGDTPDAGAGEHAEDRNHWLTEPTMPLPVYRPLLTRGHVWRSPGGTP